ncbi:hypothetical protein [Branchiibius cervicis]|uniref:Uncharacterized protein n=1 Tax=Branchiibius cervicis TaxID=908252 RepID=A0ABW2AUV5_9MICO
MEESTAPDELPVVTALRKLSVFSADQGGAYREHFAQVAHALGDDVDTKLRAYVSRWAQSGKPGTVILTGNAGTGKTAVAEAYCRAIGTTLPEQDALQTVAPDGALLKTCPGYPTPPVAPSVCPKRWTGRANRLLYAPTKGSYATRWLIGLTRRRPVFLRRHFVKARPEPTGW